VARQGGAMSGWIRVMADVHRHPKVVALPSDPARWAFIVVLAEGKAVGGRWESERHFRAYCGALARHLPALVGVGLLERDGEAILIHDWDQYQREPKADPTAADRMRRKRARDKLKAGGEGNPGDGDTGNLGDGHARDDGDVTPANGHTVTGRDIHPARVGQGQGHGQGHGQSPQPPRDGDDEDAVETYYRLTISFPAGKVLTWLNDLTRDFGDAAVSAALVAEHAADGSTRTILSRTQARLRLEEHTAAKRAAAAAAAREARDRAEAESMPEEQRSANLQRLGDMMRGAGLLPGGRDDVPM